MWCRRQGCHNTPTFFPQPLKSFPHIDAFWRLCSRQLWKFHGKNRENESTIIEYVKILWQKEKFLIMSNWPFCHSVFKRCLLQMHQIATASWKRLKLLILTPKWPVLKCSKNFSASWRCWRPRSCCCCFQRVSPLTLWNNPWTRAG